MPLICILNATKMWLLCAFLHNNFFVLKQTKKSESAWKVAWAYKRIFPNLISTKNKVFLVSFFFLNRLVWWFIALKVISNKKSHILVIICQFLIVFWSFFMTFWHSIFSTNSPYSDYISHTAIFDHILAQFHRLF